MDITQLFALGARVGEQLQARGHTVAVAESSAGGLISAALLSRAGASQYYLGGAVLYTRRAFRRFTTLSAADMDGLRSSTVPYVRRVAQHQRTRFRATWALAESGAAGPEGNSYGDPAGHVCVAVEGPVLRERQWCSGHGDRSLNMLLFATTALTLLDEALQACDAAATGSSAHV